MKATAAGFFFSHVKVFCGCCCFLSKSTILTFHVFGNQIYVETTRDVSVLNGETKAHGASAEFLPPLDKISDGAFLPKAQFTFFLTQHSAGMGSDGKLAEKKKHFHMVTGR